MNEREYEHVIDTLRDINRNIEHGFEKVAHQIEKLKD